MREILFGVLIIAFIIWEPDGLYTLWLRLKSAVQRRGVSLSEGRARPTGGDARESS